MYPNRNVAGVSLGLKHQDGYKGVSIFTSYRGTVLQIQLLKCAFGWQYSFMYWPYRDKKRLWKKSRVAFDNVSICYPCQSHS